MILTLQEGSDKAHFPLPLAFVDDPGVDILRRTLTRIQLMQSRDSWSEQHKPSMHNLDLENIQLKQEIEQLER